MNERELYGIVVGAILTVAPDVDPAGIDPRGSLTEQLDLDSIDFLSVIVELHERTGIDIPERDYGKLRTLDDALSYLSSRGDEQGMPNA